MKNFFLLVSLLSSAASFASMSELPHCSVSSEINQLCQVTPAQLKPTQFSLGMVVVKQKELKIKGKSKAEYEKYLVKNPVPFVIGNGGQFYMVDKHHLLRAVYRTGGSTVAAYVIQNLDSLSPAEFWKEMERQGFYWNRDYQNQVQPVENLPSRIQDLVDDPYRSLAGIVRDEGGYVKESVIFYLEFKWAQFFHELPASYELTLSDIQKNFDLAVAKAVQVAHSGKAAHMPGYLP